MVNRRRTVRSRRTKPIKYHRIPEGAIKVEVPDTRQKSDWSCGASALQAVCGYFGVGPDEEEEFIYDMRMDPRNGSDPHELERAARKYGLKPRRCRRMKIAELKQLLDHGTPVIIMLQAWRDEDYDHRHDRQYRTDWDDGHWVVAIGYDDTGIYFEDPSLAAIRGFLSYDELEVRWHDVGPRRQHWTRLGIAIPSPSQRAPAYQRRAIRIP